VYYQRVNIALPISAAFVYNVLGLYKNSRYNTQLLSKQDYIKI
jgi:hypothetical protein